MGTASSKARDQRRRRVEHGVAAAAAQIRADQRCTRGGGDSGADEGAGARSLQKLAPGTLSQLKPPRRRTARGCCNGCRRGWPGLGRRVGTAVVQRPSARSSSRGAPQQVALKVTVGGKDFTQACQQQGGLPVVSVESHAATAVHDLRAGVSEGERSASGIDGVARDGASGVREVRSPGRTMPAGPLLKSGVVADAGLPAMAVGNADQTGSGGGRGAGDAGHNDDDVRLPEPILPAALGSAAWPSRAKTLAPLEVPAMPTLPMMGSGMPSCNHK
jgi:hypothetical protein